jgi:hypothetical protein
MVHRAILGILILVLSVGLAAAQGLPPGSTWANQRGSELLVLSVQADGTFTGQYTNRAPGFGCQDTYDAGGQVSGNSIRFAVVWVNYRSNCNSITAWHGRIIGNNMPTSWELAYVATNGQIGITRGTDQFYRTK